MITGLIQTDTTISIYFGSIVSVKLSIYIFLMLLSLISLKFYISSWLPFFY